MDEERASATVALLPKLRRMAVRVAMIHGRPDFASDLAQDAALAVLQVPPPWNEGKAMVTAANAMREACRQLFPVSASPSTVHRWSTMRAAEAELWRRLQRRPVDEELAGALGWRVLTVRNLRALEAETVPPVTLGSEGDEQERLPHPGPTPEDTLQAKELRRDVRHAVERLAPVQGQTIVLRFGLNGDEPHGVGWIAAHRNVSRSSVNLSLDPATAVLQRALHAWAP